MTAVTRTLLDDAQTPVRPSRQEVTSQPEQSQGGPTQDSTEPVHRTQEMLLTSSLRARILFVDTDRVRWPEMSAVLTRRSPNRRADVRTDILLRTCLALDRTHSRCLIKQRYSSFQAVGCCSEHLWHLCPRGTLPPAMTTKSISRRCQIPPRGTISPTPLRTPAPREPLSPMVQGGETEARRGAGKAPTAAGPAAPRESRTSRVFRMLVGAMGMNLFFPARARPFRLLIWFAKAVLEGKLDD